MARTNTKQQLTIAGDDFTKYPIGAFNPIGPYDGPFDLDDRNTPIGSFSIVSGLESPAKNVLKVTFNNPSTSSGPHSQDVFFWLGPNVTIPGFTPSEVPADPNYTFRFAPQWLRIRFRCPPTLFSTTPVTTFAGQIYLPFFYAASAEYNSSFIKKQLYDITIVIRNNLSTGLCYLSIQTTQSEGYFGANSNGLYSTPDCLPALFYQDDTWHDIIIYYDGTSPNLIIKIWLDNNPIPLLSINDSYRFANSVYPQNPRDLLIWNWFYMRNSIFHGACNPAQDFYYISLWEMLDARTYRNPYSVVIDPVTLVFNTYEQVVAPGYQFYDQDGTPITIGFISGDSAALPQVRFVDYTLGGPYDVIPRVRDGDWVTVLIDVGTTQSRCKRFRYLSTGESQTILVNSRNAALLTVARNLDNPVVRTTDANQQSFIGV